MSVAVFTAPAVTPVTQHPHTRTALRLPAQLGPPLLAAVTAGVLIVLGLQMTRDDLKYPFLYRSDAMLVYPLAKGVMERGAAGAWVNPRLGFPGVQEWYDFPVADWLHFGGLWALARAGAAPLVAFNLYFLLGYPLAAATAAWGAGRLGASAPAAFVAGVLFALMPFHQGRYVDHYFLSAYYTVPVACVWAVRCAQGRGVGWLPAVAAGLLTAWGGAYYAFFACVLLACAAVHAAAVSGWRAGRFGLAAVLLVTAGGVAVHLPAILHQKEFGPNDRVTTRRAADCELNAMRLTYMVLPHMHHRSELLAQARWHYDTSHKVGSENDGNALGLVSAAGLVAVLLAGLFPGRWAGRLVVPGRLALGLALVCVTGGAGSLVFEFAFTQIRCYNRAAIFFGFFGAAAAVLALDRLAPRWRWGAAVLLTAACVWEQTPRNWFTPEVKMVRRIEGALYRIDADYYANLEARHPNAVVFSMPYTPWPEDRIEHARAALHTKSWRFGFGAMKYREADEWQRRASALPVAETARKLVLRGFDAILHDARMIDVCHPGPYPDDIRKALGPNLPEHVHPDGFLVYFDLRPLRDRLRAELGADEFDRQARAEADGVSALYLSGFVSYYPPGKEDTSRWMHRHGRLVLVNPLDRPRRMTVSFRVGVPRPVTVDLSTAGVWADTRDGLKHGDRVTAEFTLPPGRHEVRLTARPSPVPAANLPAVVIGDDPDLAIEFGDLTVKPAD